MLRDIDYAATAVRRAIEEKFAGCDQLSQLKVEAQAATILVEEGERRLEGSRTDLLAAVRDATSYESLWSVRPGVSR